ncbi:DUF3500 domain-containing protein [Streptomyces sp. col6]|uniref:DUF3500 domain-containing protein n=1 Tax=Streptomyces sp. col6 TaxID=2478958 RepID=UPI0011CDC947|nr:DUF3500 domain-containing protein [Streptomyces sp. col6]TXS00730.1 DUF3500 domain-containing protein [Streptomyces sp. col6]
MRYLGRRAAGTVRSARLPRPVPRCRSTWRPAPRNCPGSTANRSWRPTHAVSVSPAWAGGREADKAHYYRISTRDLLVEADNAVAAGQHAHTVWRDLNNDLGQGLLLDHYAQHGPDGRHLRRRLVSNRPTENAPLETDGWYVPEVYAKH